jgi:ATP phosphoribosyltransferase regulatory subunit
MISLLCEKNGITYENAKKLIDFSRFSLPIRDAARELRALGFGDNAKSAQALRMLELIANTLTDDEAECVSLDFSVIHGMNYYDGTVFAGYIDGVAEAVLKGGEYGKLMKKMGRAGSGLGFALYTDLLERLDDGEKNYAADVMLVCGDASTDAIAAAVKNIRESGKTVLVQKGCAGAERCAEVIILGSEV